MSATTTFALGGAAFVLVGLFLASSGRRQAAALRRFRATAVACPAQVLELRTRYARSHDGPDHVYFCPVVRFALSDGRLVEAETMRGSSPAPARVGQVVDVLYDPVQPTRVNLAHGLSTGGFSSCLFTGLGIGLTLFGLVFVAVAVAVHRLTG